MTTPTSILHAALRWHQRGFAVQPKSRGAKHWNKPAHQRPVLDTPAAIRREFSAGDYDGVKISPASQQCVAFDFDAQHNGLALYSAMLATFPFLGETYIERTGGGGLRVFLKVDGDLADLTGKITWTAANEVQLELFVHDFVIVAPSIHPNGKPYTVNKALPPAQIDRAMLDSLIAWGNTRYPKADPLNTSFRPQSTVITRDYEQFYAELTAAAERTFAIKGYNPDGRSNAFRNVLRDEKKPSAVYHREKHYLYDYAQGVTTNALELARLLGIEPPPRQHAIAPQAAPPTAWHILPEAARESCQRARLSATLAECLIERTAAGVLGATFSFADFIKAANTGRWQMGQANTTYRRWFNQLKGVFFSKTTIVGSDSMVENGNKSSSKGRPADIYVLLPTSQIAQNLLAHVRPRIFEDYHATDDAQGILVEFEPDMLQTVDTPNPQRAATSINALTAPARAAQGKKGARAQQNATREFARLQAGFAHPQFIPLPEWTIHNADEYLAAWIKVGHIQAPDEPIAQKDAARRLGKKRHKAAALLQLAGLQGEAQPAQEIRVVSADNLRAQVKQATAQVKGKAQPFVVIVKPNGLSEEIPFSSDNAAKLEQTTADHLRRGDIVNLKVRAAKVYRVVRDAPPPPREAIAPVLKRSEPTAAPRKPATRLKVVDNFVGTTYSPIWVREQLKLALIRTARAEYQPDFEVWVELTTGANVDSLTAAELVRVLCEPQSGMEAMRMWKKVV